MSKDDYSAFHALDPFFSIVMEGLSKYTDGEHYFDTLADNVLFEFRYHMAGWLQAIRGRADLMSLYSGYGNSIVLERRCAGRASFRGWSRCNPRIRSAPQDTQDRRRLR
jgi:hypothetical protein